MSFPSVHGVEEALPFASCTDSFGPVGAFFRQRISPDRLSNAIVSRFVPFSPVKMIWFPARMGDECPVGMEVFHAWLDGDKSVGGWLLTSRPEPLGPRNWSHSEAQVIVPSNTARQMAAMINVYDSWFMNGARWLTLGSLNLVYRIRNVQMLWNLIHQGSILG